MPEANQATASNAQEPEPVIEVDLDQTDPAKAVTRTQRSGGSVAQADKDADAASTERNEWLERNKAVQKRIGRLQASFNQQKAEIEAKFQRERAEMRAEMDKLRMERRTDPVAGTDAEHERKMGELRAQLEAAQEKGDSAAIARLTVDIARAENQYWAAKTAAQLQTDKGAAAVASPPAAAAAPAVRSGPTPAGSRFILANEDWWEDPEFDTEKQYANQVFLQLTRDEGMDPNDDETFDTVVERLNKKFRDLGAKAGARRSRRSQADADRGGDDPDGARAAETTRRAPVGAVQDRGSATSAVRGRRVLTQDDIGTMRAVGLNPENNDHVMRFLREAQSLENA